MKLIQHLILWLELVDGWVELIEQEILWLELLEQDKLRLLAGAVPVAPQGLWHWACGTGTGDGTTTPDTLAEAVAQAVAGDM